MNHQDPTPQRARSEQSKALRRRAILQAALEAFYQNGFVAARMEDIASAAGVSKGTLYLYFKSKEAMFEALIADIALPKISAYEAAFARSTHFAQLVHDFVASVPLLLRQSPLPKLVKVLISDAKSFPQMVNLYRENVIKRALGLITATLSQAKAAGQIDIGDPELTARLVVAPMIFSLLWIVVFEPGDQAPLQVEKLLAEHKNYLFKAFSIQEAKQ